MGPAGRPAEIEANYAKTCHHGLFFGAAFSCLRACVHVIGGNRAEKSMNCRFAFLPLSVHMQPENVD